LSVTDSSASGAKLGVVRELPGGQQATGPLNPVSYLRTLQESTVVLWTTERVKQEDGSTKAVYHERLVSGKEILTPGGRTDGADSHLRVLRDRSGCQRVTGDQEHKNRGDDCAFHLRRHWG
jgi:hypothetical protein